MALSNLGAVTDSLLRLLEESIKASPAWSLSLTLDVTSQPPDQLSGDNTVGLYLYHVGEDPHHLNTLPRTTAHVPQVHAALPLVLHYQLTAHSDITGKDGPLRAQLLFGLAMKALHDWPYLDSSSKIGVVPVYSTELRHEENPLRISFQPTEVSDAANYWTAGSQALRLAAYYRVEVAFLEPKPVTLSGGPITSYNTPIFASRRPHIQATRNLVDLLLPGETTPRRVEVSPAQVTYGDTLEFIGSGFSGGPVEVHIKRAGWDDPIEAGSSWGVFGNAEKINTVVGESADGVTFLAGVYTVEIVVQKTQTLANGGTATLPLRSNVVPVLIVPELTSASAPDGLGVFTLTGRVFAHTDLDPSAVEVWVGDTVLTSGTVGSLNQGEFGIQNATSIEVRLPSGTASGLTVQVRVRIDGAESRPQWVTAP